jgi:hypothetical protein
MSLSTARSPKALATIFIRRRSSSKSRSSRFVVRITRRCAIGNAGVRCRPRIRRQSTSRPRADASPGGTPAVCSRHHRAAGDRARDRGLVDRRTRSSEAPGAIHDEAIREPVRGAVRSPAVAGEALRGCGSTRRAACGSCARRSHWSGASGRASSRCSTPGRAPPAPRARAGRGAPRASTRPRGARAAALIAAAAFAGPRQGLHLEDADHGDLLYERVLPFYEALGVELALARRAFPRATVGGQVPVRIRSSRQASMKGLSSRSHLSHHFSFAGSADQGSPEALPITTIIVSSGIRDGARAGAHARGWRGALEVCCRSGHSSKRPGVARSRARRRRARPRGHRSVLAAPQA